MKKVLGIIALTGLFIATSCKGDYNCDCTISGATATAGSYTDVKKSDAETSCNSLETLAKLGDPSASCSVNKK